MAAASAAGFYYSAGVSAGPTASAGSLDPRNVAPKPADSVRLSLNLNGWRDKSDTQAAQLIEVQPSTPALVNPMLDAYPRAPQNSRAADWDEDPALPLRRNDRLLQASLLADIDLSNSITLTSISALTRFRQRFGQDIDGTSLQNLSLYNIGHIHSVSQELRLAADSR